MAEAILKAELAGGEAAGDLAMVRVSSAGLDAGPREAVSGEAAHAIKRLGLKMERRGAHRLTGDELRRADLVLTMTHSQKERIGERWPDTLERTFVLSEFSGSGRGGIQDPIGGSERVYSGCARQLATEIKKLVPRLRRRLKQRRVSG
jgi:protein-tyrosine phosphatase